LGYPVCYCRYSCYTVISIGGRENGTGFFLVFFPVPLFPVNNAKSLISILTQFEALLEQIKSKWRKYTTSLPFVPKTPLIFRFFIKIMRVSYHKNFCFWICHFFYPLFLTMICKEKKEKKERTKERKERKEYILAKTHVYYNIYT